LLFFSFVADDPRSSDSQHEQCKHGCIVGSLSSDRSGHRRPDSDPDFES